MSKNQTDPEKKYFHLQLEKEMRNKINGFFY